MPCFSIQVPVTVLVNITVDAPDIEAAQVIDINSIKPDPVLQTYNGICANHDAFDVNWIGSDGYCWSESNTTPCDPTDAAVFVGYDGEIYPTRDARDAAIDAIDAD